MCIEPKITRVSSGFSGYIWLDTKIVKKIIIIVGGGGTAFQCINNKAL